MPELARRPKVALAAIVALVAITCPAFGQITSTSAGGEWSEGGTWIGGQVPTADDDVVVDGPVIVRTGDACRNLTVNAAGSLTDFSGGNFTDILTVEGDVTNRGTVRPGPAQLQLRIRGDLHNEAIWEPNFTNVDGSVQQALSVAGGASLNGRMTVDNAAGVVAATDLRFSDGVLDLQGNRLEMQGFAVLTDDTFLFEDGILSGPATLQGTLQVRTNGFSIEGTVTNEGIIEGHPGGLFTDTLPVTGRLVNAGTIRDGVAQFQILLDGEAHNAGTWGIEETQFTGVSGQRLSHEPDVVLAGGWGAQDDVTIEAVSDLVFQTAEIDLNGGTLRAGSFGLLLDDGSSVNNGSLDVRNLTMAGNSTLGGGLRVADDVTLHGAAQVFTRAVFEGAVVVADTLRDAPGGRFTETVDVLGRLRNEGSIEGNLALVLHGDVVNAGSWTNSFTTLAGSTQQSMSVENDAPFGGRLILENETGSARAASDLHFSGGVFDLQARRLEMGGFAAVTDDTFVFEDGILSGPVTLQGTLQVLTNGFSIVGTAINEGAIEGHPGGHFTDVLPVNGRLVNHGVIRDGTAQLRIHLDGEAHNAGSWGISGTQFIGAADQRLTHEPDVVLAGGWGAADSVSIEAAGDLVFGGAAIDLNGGSLVMESHNLRLDAGTTFEGGRLDVRNLTMAGNSTLGGGLRVAADVTLHGAAQVFTRAVFEGTVIVADTLRDAPGGRFTETVEMQGSLRNEGVITGRLALVVFGDLINHGAWTNTETALAGRGRRTIRGERIESTISISGEEVVFTGDVFLNELRINSDAFARVSSKGALHLPSGGLTGTTANFANFGRLVMHSVATPSRTLNFFDASIRTPGDVDFDTLIVDSFGNQVPTSFTAAVQNWWRIRSNTSSTTTLPSVTFGYDDQQLSRNVESELKVFHSADEGNTWAQISTSQNLSLDAENNIATLQNAPGSGDFLLSSETDPVSVIPNVIVSITGRENIRIGAPNRYLVHYVNNSDQPTGDMLMQLRLTPGAHIDRILPSAPDGVEVRPFEPEDLFVSEVQGDTTAFLWIEGMDPREERSFTVVATGGIELGKTDGARESEVAVVTLTVGVLLLANAVVLDYLLDTATNTLEELTATSTSEQRDVFQAAVDRTNEEWFGSFEKPGNSIVLATLETLFKRATGIVTLPFTFVKLMAYDIPAALFRGADRFLNGPPQGCRVGTAGSANKIGSDIADAPTMASGRELAGLHAAASDAGAADAGEFCIAVYGTHVSLEAVRSWDPNEKNGPSGFGTDGFVTEVGEMNYTILFENKAEATAEAFRIVIHDTLSSVFDPETVKFGETSHEGFETTREGNILRWEIEGIELPPNVNPPEGEGFVTFSVNAVDGLPSGTRLENGATIVFDVNPPITTNTVVNTLDFTPPETTMDPLADEIEANEVVVRWSSDDTESGSGARLVNVYAAVDGGGFSFVGTSSTDSLAVSVDRDADYSFYALAVDNVGNAEVVRPEPVSTTVTIPVGTEDDVLPFNFALHQNYPNPFTTTTTITYTIPTTDASELHVYDILGRRVAVLVDEVQQQGTYVIPWNARDLASGTYFYRLRNGAHAATKRMVLVK